ncbi:type VII secretion protein EccB [Frankia tisae]|uniref:type VII secretion protein EccB n=1 Tax=Frankia tisae TaxID=2950104 RepID=UPI0021C1B97C|nr:type VII secretion protein EccB [Frankia tisae]
MQSRRDQVDAQSYLLTRLTSALVRAEPDALELPTRRDSRGLIAGILLALTMLAGVAIWALISSGGSTAWRQPGKLIIDRSTGSRFLLVVGELRPVRNVASARLAVDGAVDPVTVAGSKLARVPRGAPLGTVDAPDLLPAPDHLNVGVWRACAGTDPAVAVRLDIGGPPAERRITGDAGLLVSAAGRDYLLWHGRRLAMGRPWAAAVLGYGATTPVPVDEAWLELVPAGPDMEPVDVPGRGTPGPQVGGRPAALGQLFAAPAAGGTGTVHYLLLPAGLTPLSTTQAALALAEAGGAPELPITPAELAAGPRTAVGAAQDELPAVPPPLRAPGHGEAVCVESAGHPDAGHPDAGHPDTESLDVVLAAPPAAPGTRAAGGVAVSVRPRGGALLVARADVAAKDQPALLVDGVGIRYPLAGDAVRALGFQVERATVVPPRLLGLLPAGPLLTTPEGG